MTLYEKHRPKTFADVVGQDGVISTINSLRQRGLGGRAYWIPGKSGTGKTSIARLIAAELAEDICTFEVDAAKMTPGRLDEIEVSSRYRWLGEKPGQAFLVNEAHGLKTAAINQLLVMLERIPSHVVWLFTTTCAGQEELFEDKHDTAPLLSRCIKLPLSQRDLAKPFALHCMNIAIAEGLDGGQPLEAFERLAKDWKCNMRDMLQWIDKGGMMIPRKAAA